MGLHDEIFQGATPVLAGVDAASTYCYLLAAEQHRDADTWGVHLLDAAEQGLRPDYTIADAGRGLRAGQQAAWGDTPCHGDVFHTIRTQSPYGMRLLASGVRVRPAQRDDMLDLQGVVVVTNDALDHQPQDSLPLGAMLVGLQSGADALAERAPGPASASSARSLFRPARRRCRSCCCSTRRRCSARALALPGQLFEGDHLGLVGFDQFRRSARSSRSMRAAQPVVGGLPSAVPSLGQEALIPRRQLRGIP